MQITGFRFDPYERDFFLARLSDGFHVAFRISGKGAVAVVVCAALTRQ